MYNSFQKHISQQLDEIRAAGTYKRERVITTPQDTRIRVGDGQPVLNLCANNYLGLAEHPAVPTYRQSLAWNLRHLGDHQTRDGRFPEAERSYRAAIDLCGQAHDPVCLDEAKKVVR